MRTIKFRAWDTEDNAMRYYAQKNGLCFGRAGFFVPLEKPLMVMQFTGLTDKNGKEIYEGDILSIEKVLRVNKKRAATDIPTVIASVEFADGCFTAWGNLASNISRAEVIGNIYENPDLLSNK